MNKTANTLFKGLLLCLLSVTFYKETALSISHTHRWTVLIVLYIIFLVVSVLCSNRVSQMTKTYNDIEAVTRLLEEVSKMYRIFLFLKDIYRSWFMIVQMDAKEEHT
jgi:hypothetical protein